MSRANDFTQKKKWLSASHFYRNVLNLDSTNVEAKNQLEIALRNEEIRTTMSDEEKEQFILNHLEPYREFNLIGIIENIDSEIIINVEEYEKNGPVWKEKEKLEQKLYDAEEAMDELKRNARSQDEKHYETIMASDEYKLRTNEVLKMKEKIRVFQNSFTFTDELKSFFTATMDKNFIDAINNLKAGDIEYYHINMDNPYFGPDYEASDVEGSISFDLEFRVGYNDVHLHFQFLEYVDGSIKLREVRG